MITKEERQNKFHKWKERINKYIIKNTPFFLIKKVIILYPNIIF